MAAVTAADVAAARPAVEAIARRTPVLSTRTISERAGGVVALKAENLQRTGSFKIRGVVGQARRARRGRLPQRRGRGVGGQPRAEPGGAARARAASRARCSCPTTRRCPRSRPRAGRARPSTSGAGRSTTAWRCAQERAREGGLAFVHPFDDPDIVAGQGSLGLELLEDVPDLAKVVVPVGGGGLCAGVGDRRQGGAAGRARWSACRSPPARRIPSRCASGEPVPASSALTIADGIAVKRPGDLTLELLSRYADEIVVVDEDATAEAMVVLMERCKLVVEGAGAVGVAALLGGQVARRRRGHDRRRAVGRQRRPGAAGRGRPPPRERGRPAPGAAHARAGPARQPRALLVRVAETGANIVDVSHVREGLDLHVRETAVELVLETRGHDHAESVVAVLNTAGYQTHVLH